MSPSALSKISLLRWKVLCTDVEAEPGGEEVSVPYCMIAHQRHVCCLRVSGICSVVLYHVVFSPFNTALAECSFVSVNFDTEVSVGGLVRTMGIAVVVLFCLRYMISTHEAALACYL